MKIEAFICDECYKIRDASSLRDAICLNEADLYTCENCECHVCAEHAFRRDNAMYCLECAKKYSKEDVIRNHILRVSIGIRKDGKAWENWDV